MTMKKDSLEKAREILLNHLDNSNIKEEDKLELIMNLYHFLDPVKYENNIKVLRRENKNERSN